MKDLTTEKQAVIRFLSRGKMYEVKPDYFFMDNGSCIQYMSDAWTLKPSTIVSKKEWNRIMPFLKMSYRDYGYQKVKIYRLP